MTIMYVCDCCYESVPESCGRFDRNELRVLPDGNWVCSECHDSWSDWSEDERPDWDTLPVPSEHLPAS